MGDLNSTIAGVKADPRNPLNAPRVLGAVARYVPNAFGLVPAAAIDQVTGPIVRGINSQFNTHYDPHYVTDQILNAVGLLAGRPELPPASTPAEIAAWRAETLNPELGTNARLRALPDNVHAMPDAKFAVDVRQQYSRLSTLPLAVQRHFLLNAGNLVEGPAMEDMDFPGYTGPQVADVRTGLNRLSDHYRPQGAEGKMIADEIDRLNDSFTAMAGRQPGFVGAVTGRDPSILAEAPNLVDLLDHLPIDEEEIERLALGERDAAAPSPAPAEIPAANDNDRAYPAGVLPFKQTGPVSPSQPDAIPSLGTFSTTRAASELAPAANDNNPGHIGLLTAPPGAPSTQLDPGPPPPSPEDQFRQELGEEHYQIYDSLSDEEKQKFLALIRNLVPKDNNAPTPDGVVAMPQRLGGGGASPSPGARVGLNLPNAFSSGMDLASAIASRVAGAGGDLGFGDLGGNVILPLSIAASPGPRFPPQTLPGQQTQAPGAVTPTTPSW